MSASHLDPNSRTLATIAGTKRPIEAISYTKRLRSKIPRRRRIPLLPIVNGGALINSVEDEAESSSSCFHGEVSFDSGVRFAGSEAPKAPYRAPHQARASKTIALFQGGIPGGENRRITRSYAKQQERIRLGEIEGKTGSGAGSLSVPRGGAKISKSDSNVSLDLAVSELSHVSGGENLKQKAEKTPGISESSCLQTVSEAILVEIPNSVGSKVQIQHRTAARGVEPCDLDLNSDLACSERLTSEDEGDDRNSEHSTCNELTVSEYETEPFFMSSECDMSEYSLSDLFESSGDDFSERSNSNSAPSASFSLFLQLSQQFARLSSRMPSQTPRYPSHDFILMKFEEEVDEESYKALRGREKRELVLHNYSVDYSLSTGTSDLILRQRLMMVNWIVEYANTVGLQRETLFLGVSLMDRFLSRGYFTIERNLQLLGVACITLATRIEENQPYNSIRNKRFTVGSSVYSRCEVVAMEWLVMEVLKFQCFVPTTHNFLWYYLKAAKADPKVKSLAHYLAVLSLLDYETLRFWPSTVAAGLVILACLATNLDSSCHIVMETHVRTKNDDLPECIQNLEWLVKYAC